MNRDTRKADAGQSVSEVKSVLEEVIQQGAREMLLRAIEAEVAGYIGQHAHLRDEAGHRLVVRNGHPVFDVCSPAFRLSEAIIRIAARCRLSSLICSATLPPS